MPYGAPPGWYPPPGQAHGFPPGPFPPYGYPPQGPPGQFQQGQMPKPGPIGPTPTGGRQQGSPPAPGPDAEPKSLARPAAEMAAAAVTKAPTPPAAKPSPSETPIAQPSTSQSAAAAAVTKAAPTGPKPNRVQPAVPLQSPALVKKALQSNSGNTVSPQAAGATPASLRDATQAATAAVAAAMAKLPNQQQNGNAMDNLTKQVNAMRTNDPRTTDPIRAPRNAGTGTNFSQGRGRGRGGARNAQKVEVPATDFDFETSNAKFNKDDLVKEAIAGSPLGETGGSPEPDVPAAGYNKTKSFFDDISSESKDRTDGGGGRPGGREWRGEEQKKNVETFGQGSVDNGYRGGFRGRGRGRGYRGGRGYGGDGQPRGRGGYRGRDAQLTTQ
jgi:protein LSM14